MGMESFNAMPDIPAEEGSERIGDVEKAKVMAYAGNADRSKAAEYMAVVKGETEVERPDRGFLSKGDAREWAEVRIKTAENREETAGEIFDERKKIDN
jgi:hypothetical protein